MQLNKQDEKLLQELLKKYKQGIISGFYSGNNITFTPTGCRDKIISSSGSGGGGGGQISFEKSIEELRTLAATESLIVGAKYTTNDFQTLYDQPVSGVYKSDSDGENLVLTAISTSQFAPIVQSLQYPDDIIHFDINVTATYITESPCKGKIIYREDKNGNSADFDWRKVLTYVSSDSSEHLMFEDSIIVADAKFQNQSSLLGTPYGISLEFPNNYFNGNRLIGISNSVVSNSTIIGECAFITQSIIANVTINSNGLTKTVNCNMYNSTLSGGADRLFGGYILFTTISGFTQYLNDASFITCNIGGNAYGLNNIHFETTTTDCSINSINGLSVFDIYTKFKDVTITSTTPGAIFGNIRLDCSVENKTITETLYPELFNMGYAKTIYKTPNGNVFYKYLDDTNTWIFTQIV